jgi:MPBQ/MSBQ methyltransferase
MRLIQHKKEAYWFYRFLSALYDRWVNPLFWTERMRGETLALARLDSAGIEVLDVGAGTGFATEGIVEHVTPASVTMLDQSPHQLARAQRKPALRDVVKVRGDAEDLPFPTDRFDRYVSTGSVEYWPDPQRAVVEAYRVIKPGGIAMLAGPLPPRQRLARALAELWMLFPPESDYRRWFEAAGFEDIEVAFVAPDWHGGGPSAYGIAIAGRKPAAGESPLALEPPAERVDEPMTMRRRALFAARFVAGSAAGAAFVPIAAVLALRERVRRGA